MSLMTTTIFERDSERLYFGVLLTGEAIDSFRQQDTAQSGSAKDKYTTKKNVLVNRKAPIERDIPILVLMALRERPSYHSHDPVDVGHFNR